MFVLESAKIFLLDVLPVLASSSFGFRLTDSNTGARDQIAKIAALNEDAGRLIVGGRGDRDGLASDQENGKGGHPCQSRQDRGERGCVH